MSDLLHRRVHALTVVLLLILSAAPSLVWAYEVGAHALLTAEAFDRSVLADGESGPLARLGIDHVLSRRLKSTAVDPDFASGSARDIVSFGARFEDLPDRELRFLNHFYDPQNGGRGLSTVIGLRSLPSPDWELEDRESIGAQLYSLKDALAFYYLTLVSQDDSVRERYLVLLLEAIGRGVHHLQDMAQPAHTRNDPHPLGLDGDLYEQATDDLAELQPADFPRGIVYPTEAVDLHTFNSARVFWESSGLGLAELTARNFVSQDTNFSTLGNGLMTAAEFPAPAPLPCDGQGLITQVDMHDLDPHPHGFSIPGAMWFVGTPVHDRYLSGDEITLCNPRTSAYGLFDFDLAAVGRPMHFQLNRYTWDQTRAILLPRAIAYSAGLINYFFRGMLEVEMEESADTVSLTIRNVSLGEFALADGSRGTTPAEFEIWYDAVDGTRKPAQVSTGRDLSGATIPYGSAHTLRFVRPQDLRPSQTKPYILVFRGTIGSEEGIIGVAFGPRDAAFAVLPEQGTGDKREIDHTALAWRLAPAPVVAGNVDWKGLKPGDVLSWMGPQSRYFYAPGQVDALSPTIYQGGAVLASAPGGVLGAALRRDSEGRSELLAITYAAGQVGVHARGAADASGASPWRSLYSFASAPPLSPAFANASASEFQFLTTDDQRIKIHISLSDVTLEQIPARGSGKQTGRIVAHTSSALCEYETTTDESYAVHWDTPTVMCADYQGDTESLCQVDVDPALSLHQTLHEALDGVTVQKNLSLAETTSTARVLTIGALRIPIMGSATTTEATIHDVFHPFDDDPPAIDERQSTHTRDFGTKILYLDARNEIAAFVETDTVRDLSATVSDPVHAPGAGYLSTADQVDATHVESRMVVMHGGEIETLSSSTLAPAVRHTTQQGAIANAQCPQVAAQDVDVSVDGNRTDDKGLNIMGFVHPRVLQDAPVQGFAVDGAGDLAASVSVISLDARGAEQIGKTWNFLSGGSLESLMPPASTNPRYFPIGALR